MLQYKAVEMLVNVENKAQQICTGMVPVTVCWTSWRCRESAGPEAWISFSKLPPLAQLPEEAVAVELAALNWGRQALRRARLQKTNAALHQCLFDLLFSSESDLSTLPNAFERQQDLFCVF